MQPCMMAAYPSCAFLIAGLLLAHVHPALGATAPGPKCQAAKLLATGKETASELACHAKAAKKGIAVDQRCLDKAQSKFAASFQKAEAKGGCTTTGDGGGIGT